MKKIIIIALLVVAVLGTAALVWQMNSNQSNNIGEKVISFINENFPAASATLVNVSEKTEDGYELDINTSSGEAKLHVSPSGRFLYLGNLDMESFMETEDLNERINSLLADLSAKEPTFASQEIVITAKDISERGEDGYTITLTIGTDEMPAHVSFSGRYIYPEFIDMNEKIEKPEAVAGNFMKSKDDVCLEDGKPVIYYFGSESCPHCVWQRPVITSVAQEFGDNVVFYDRTDSEEDTDILYQYSSGSIPTIVLGCRYYRSGSGELSGQETDMSDIRSLICELTENQPAEICQ